MKNSYASEYFAKNRFMIWILICGCCVVMILTIARLYYNSATTIAPFLENIQVVDKPLYFTMTIKFKKLSAFSHALKTPDLLVMPDCFIIKDGTTQWICDTSLYTAYRPIPSYSIEKSSTIFRLFAHDNASIDFASLNGTYLCNAYVCEDPMLYSNIKVVRVYITDCTAQSSILSRPENKQVTNKRYIATTEEKNIWLNYIKEHYPASLAIAPKENDGIKTMLYSTPQNVNVYVAFEYEIKKFFIDGAIQENLIKQNIITSRHYMGKTPQFINFFSRRNLFVFYEFFTTTDRILPDGQVFESIEKLEDATYRIIRGYYIHSAKNKTPNILSTALFQMQGLAPDDIISLVDTKNRFIIDNELFDLFIHPILRQAKKEGAHPGYTPRICKDILTRAGKLIIETEVGTYRMMVSRSPDNTYSLITDKRTTDLLMRDPAVVRNLPSFIYRKQTKSITPGENNKY